MYKNFSVTRCTVNKLRNTELRFYKLPKHKKQALEGNVIDDRKKYFILNNLEGLFHHPM